MDLDLKLEKILDAVEIAEYPLLAWGITNASMTDGELKNLISACEPIGDVELLKNELLNRGLLFETPTGTYRSRIAEISRLTLTLRQWFPGIRSDAGQLLIHDLKFQLRPRSFPKRDTSREQVLDELRSSGLDFNFEFLDAGLPEKISKFQFRSITEIFAALDVEADRSIVVSSGTGSGKTNAYFIPMFNWIARELEKRGHLGVRTIALYPRVELLKDQLMNALMEVRKINEVLKQKLLPTIRIGVWFGDTPQKLTSDHLEKYRKNWEKTKYANKNAWKCPFLRCPVCEVPHDLVLLNEGMGRKVVTLLCPGESCSFAVTSDELVFTRDALVNPNSQCDVLFTTTESVNRQLGSKDGDRGFGLLNNSHLRSVLVDEAHIYDGLAGAQVAYLFRRIRHRVGHPLAWVSLSATLENPSDFIKDLTGLDTSIVEPKFDELEYRGAEYILAARHYLESKKSPLSSAIQLAMLLSRMLDPNNKTVKSQGLFGKKLFVFGDKHDVVNRLYFSLASAEGYQVPNGESSRRTPKSLATLRSADQLGLNSANRETGKSRYDDGQWWKAAEELGHSFLSATSKIIGITSSQFRGVKKEADVIVATGSLEVGYDDISVGAVLQYKVPKSPASFLQRKGRAGRTQMMRPITAVVLSPYGPDRAAWTNAENQLFMPKLSARRLPMSNRYTQKMQATYVLLDWLHSYAGVPKSWNLLTGTYFKTEELGNSIKCLQNLLQDPVAQQSFAHQIGRALVITEREVHQILWSVPRGILSVVVPTALRRLEASFGEDAKLDKDPLKEFISSNLFSELHSPEVDLLFPEGNEKKIETLPIQRVLREFAPGNISRHFGKRYWIPVANGQESIEVGLLYGSVDTGLVVHVDGVELAVHRPTELKLQEATYGLNDSTTAFGHWGTVFNTLGNALQFSTSIEVWDSQSVVLEAFLHSRGTNVLVTRFMDRSQGWTSPTNGDPERINTAFVVGEQKVVLGFELNVDGIRIELKRPTQYPSISRSERSQRLQYLLRNDDYLKTISNSFDLERVARSLIRMMLDAREDIQLTTLTDAEFKVQLLNTARSILLDQNSVDDESNLTWLDLPSVGIIRNHLAEVFGDRSSDWKLWFDNRMMASLAALVLDAFRTMIPGLDADDIDIDVAQSPDDGSMVCVWITETSSGGNGSIELIANELSVESQFDSFVYSLLKPREFELLDQDIRGMILFAQGHGALLAQDIRTAWGNGLQVVENSISSFYRELESTLKFPSQSSRSVFMNRFLGISSDPSLLKFGIDLATRWDSYEERIGFEIPPEVVSLLWMGESSIDSPLHLSNPSPARRASAVSSIAWTRPTQGMELDYEISNPFDFDMTLDIPTLRNLISIKLDGPGSDAISLSPVQIDILKPHANEVNSHVLRIVNNPRELRRKIIEATVEHVEDDAIFVYRRTSEVFVENGQFVAIMRGDFNSA